MTADKGLECIDDLGEGSLLCSLEFVLCDIPKADRSELGKLLNLELLSRGGVACTRWSRDQEPKSRIGRVLRSYQAASPDRYSSLLLHLRPPSSIAYYIVLEQCLESPVIQPSHRHASAGQPPPPLLLPGF